MNDQTTTTEKFRRLTELRREVSNFDSARALLDWDLETGMPPNGTDARGRIAATLANASHSVVSSKDYGDLIVDVHTHSTELTQIWERRAIALEHRHWTRETALSSDFVRQKTELTATGYSKWLDAKQRGDWSVFAPTLERIVMVMRREVDLRRTASHAHPYDVLLGDYEEGMTVEKYDPFFSTMKEFLIPFTQMIVQAGQRNHLPPPIRIGAPVGVQERVAKRLIPLLGYDMEGGRIGVTEHPFMTRIHDGDVRIAVNFDEGNVLDGVGSVVHECGHALYSQGLPSLWDGLCIGDAASYGIDESQSRLWENMIGRSREFAKVLHAIFLEEGVQVPRDMTPERLYLEMNRVQPSYIRTQSDEVTYNLHVALRYEIEKRLIEGSLEVAGVPDAWNRGMQELLGLTVTNDADGPLQDVHWSGGWFGYFPTYALGNAYAAKLFGSAMANVPDLAEQMGNGDFFQVLAWMRTHVHVHGRFLPPHVLIRRATGSTSDDLTSWFFDYLTGKFTDLYRL